MIIFLICNKLKISNCILYAYFPYFIRLFFFLRPKFLSFYLSFSLVQQTIAISMPSASNFPDLAKGRCKCTFFFNTKPKSQKKIFFFFE